MLFKKILTSLVLINSLIFQASGAADDPKTPDQQLLDADRKKIEGILKKAETLSSAGSDSCVVYATEAMRLARAVKSPELEAPAVKILSDYYFGKEDYHEALHYTDQLLVLYTETGDSLKKAESFNVKGLSSYYLGIYDDAVHAYHNAIRLANELNDNKLLAKLYQNLGVLYAELNMPTDAMNYYNKALDLCRVQKNKTDEAGILQNIGIIYSDEKKYREALGYYLSALKIFNEQKDTLSVSMMYLSLGSLYEDQADYSRALSYYNKSLDEFLRQDYKFGIAYSYFSLGSVYRKTSAYQNALEALQKSLQYSREISLLENEIDCHRELAEVYSLTGDYKSAFEEMKSYSELHDSLFSDNIHKEVAETETRINAQIKDEEIENLRSEREKVVKDMVRRTVVSIIIVTLTVIIIVVTIYYSRSLKKSNLRLTEEVDDRLNAEKELISIKNNLEDRVVERTSELEKAKVKAEESDRLKSAFIANMSHEIRTPLNAITGFAGLLLRENIPVDKRKEYNDQILKNNKILIKMIEDLIDTSKIESGSLQLHTSRIKIELFLYQFIEPLTENLTRRNKTSVEIFPDKPEISSQTIMADPVRLQQVLWHILDNAVKFTNKGSIHYGCREIDQKMVFYVNDTGIGIPEKHKDVIFEKFRQLDESARRKFGGTGLGLYYARKIAEIMGGQIWFESKNEGGTVFYFSLPASA